MPAPSIDQMIKNVAWNELQASEHPAHYYRYVERDIMPGESSTVDEIGTPHGSVDRPIEVDHHVPSQKQIEENQQLLAELPGNAQLQQSRFKDQQSERARRDNVIKDIPQAFVYTYEGRDQQGRIMLKFRPAPDFQPSSRQSLILEGMAGELWVDPSTQRMVKINGSLIKDVKIGWGFLARLKRGGTFLMEQSQGPDGTWHQKLLSVHFDGTILVFKHIHIRVKQIRCCFEPVPDNLSIQEAVHLLNAGIALPADWQSRLEAIQKSAPSN
ncbi:MAG TPA: hypothetical protein VNM47_10635 [Terriglobia bacterium]|nr:hypothetical protein [Terriglobia bacterium]